MAMRSFSSAFAYVRAVGRIRPAVRLAGRRGRVTSRRAARRSNVVAFVVEQVSLLGGADETVKMSTSPTLLLDTRSAVHSTPATQTFSAEAFTGSPGGYDDDDDNGGNDDGDDDVTAELSAPVAVAAATAVAGLGHTEWQLLAAAGAGVAVLLSVALALAYRRSAFCGSPALHKVVRPDDAECPPLLDHAPRPLDLAKYLGKSLRTSSFRYRPICVFRKGRGFPCSDLPKNKTNKNFFL